jgi:putative hydrolase of the HAD superfamily
LIPGFDDLSIPPTPLAIVFDLVGTLIVPSPDVATTYQHFGRMSGSTLSLDVVSSRFRQAWQQANWSRPSHADQELAWRTVVANVFVDVPDTDSLFEQLWNHYATPHAWRVFDDVLPTCMRLDEAALQLAIGSNFDLRMESICRELGLSKFCKNIFSSAHVGAAKPDREFFDQVAQRLNICADQLWMVGDNLETDIRAAADAGWYSVHLRRNRTDETTDPLSPFPVIESLHGLMEMLPK